jgi:hypothetical protein
MPSIYIAGPMAGKPLYNFPAFDAAAAQLARDGWTPINPAQLDRDAGFDPERDPVTPEFLKGAMKRDLLALLEADALALLPGWPKSKGALAEKAVAQWRGIPIYTLNEKMSLARWLVVLLDEFEDVHEEFTAKSYGPA